MPSETLAPLAIVTAFAAAALATPAVRAFARRIGAVAPPNDDRWHRRPTAMLGGLAIVVAVLAALLLLELTRESTVIIACAGGAFILGLIDDFFHLKPYQKLVGQLLAASAVVYFGLVLPWTGSMLANMVITLIWLVGITNAVNMLDNMDGLAAGVCAIAGIFLALTFYLNGEPTSAAMVAVFSAALLGFLIYNHNPASIFMGDCGSMFAGFFLAGAALLSAQAGGGRSRSLVAVLVVPVLVLCIPIFDTTFVTLMRKLAGRAVSQGGRDHTSHRLVALGLSERQAVWMLYVFAIVGGSLAILARDLELDVSLAVIAGFSMILSLLGVYLAEARIYNEDEIALARTKPFVSFLVDLSYKRRIFEVALDVLLIILAYYGAYALVFGPMANDSRDWQLFLRTLPMVVAVKLAALLAGGLYRGMWRYTSVADVLIFARAVGLSSAGSILVLLYLFRFEGFSRAVFAIDAIMLFALVCSSRFAFRLLRRLLPTSGSEPGPKVLIFGAGDGGEMTLRELMNNPDLRYVPVGFIDDDPRKTGKLLHGLPIYSAQESLPALRRKTGAGELFLATDRISDSRLRSLLADCKAAHMPIQRTKLEVYRLADDELGWVLSGDVLKDSAGTASAPPLFSPRLRLSSPEIEADH